MDLQQLYHQAQAAQKSGNPAEAERLYRQILSTAALPEVLVNLGNLLAAQGRRDEALAGYDQALAARPDFFEALFNRGNLLLEMKRSEEALASYDKALASRRDFAGVWNNRGTALRNLQRLEEALASLEQAVALSPGHFHALTNRAMTLLDLRRLSDALAGAERALTVQPGFAEALYVQANVLRDMGRPQEALASYDAALAANPAHAHALNGAAQAAAILCDWTRTAALSPRIKTNAGGGPALIQPFVLLGYSDDPALQLRCAQTYIRRILPVRPAPLWTGARP